MDTKVLSGLLRNVLNNVGARYKLTLATGFLLGQVLVGISEFLSISLGNSYPAVARGFYEVGSLPFLSLGLLITFAITLWHQHKKSTEMKQAIESLPGSYKMFFTFFDVMLHRAQYSERTRVQKYRQLFIRFSELPFENLEALDKALGEALVSVLKNSESAYKKS